jgi:hypothetical protein
VGSLDAIRLSGGSALRNNTAANLGGAVHVLGAVQSVEVAGASLVGYNRALGGGGGAFLITGGLASFSLTGASNVSNNTADSHGACG